MLKQLLLEIKSSDHISKHNIANKLNKTEQIIEDGFEQLIRMGYIKEYSNINNCNIKCGNCPYINTCNKATINTFVITEKGERLLFKDSVK